MTEAAHRLLGWQDHFAEAEICGLVTEWRTSVTDDHSYAVLVDWIAMLAHGDNQLPECLRELALEILEDRLTYPEIGNARWDWCEVASRVVDLGPVRIATIVLDLLSSGQLMLLGSEREAELLQLCARQASADVWAEVSSRIAGGDWRTAMSIRGWFLTALPPAMILEWVGQSVERGRLVAGLAGSSEVDELPTPEISIDTKPDPISVALIDRFPGDHDISGSVAGDFMSGSWIGPWSDRLRQQLALLERWQFDDSLPEAFREWTRQVAGSLQLQMNDALEREAEERW